MTGSSQVSPIRNKAKGKGEGKDFSPTDKTTPKGLRKNSNEKKPLKPAQFPMLSSPSFQRAQRKYENKMNGVSTDDDSNEKSRSHKGKQKSAFPMTSDDFIEPWEKNKSTSSKRPSLGIKIEESPPKKLKGVG